MPLGGHVQPMGHMEILVLACVLLGVALGMLGLALTLLAAVERRPPPPPVARPRRGHARNGTYAHDDDTPAGGR